MRIKNMNKFLILPLFIFISLFINCKAEFDSKNDPLSSSYKNESNAYLNNLTLSNGELLPVFDKFTYEYTAGVTNQHETITVTPATETVYSSVTVNSASVISGFASSAIELNVGNNIITVVVTAEDGITENTYQIAVYRAVALAKTGQTDCYDSWGNPDDCADTGQDGDLQKGAEWPDPRFEVNGDCLDTDDTCTATDKLTGLTWTRKMNLMPSKYPGFDNIGTPDDGMLCWANELGSDTFEYISKLNTDMYAGFSDWHLPNIHELRSIIHYGEPDLFTWLNDEELITFIPAGGAYYFTSTTCMRDGIWSILLNNVTGDISYITNYNKTVYSSYVWAVRSSRTYPITLYKTGQDRCYDTTGVSDDTVDCTGTGQDGELQIGVEWPDPRFVENGDETVTDRLTGLTWQASSVVNQTWQDGLDYANESTASGYDDWRVPNINEMATLANMGITSHASWLTQNGFNSFQTYNTNFWTSTTYSASASSAYIVEMDTSYFIKVNSKSNQTRILLVRDAD